MDDLELMSHSDLIDFNLVYNASLQVQFRGDLTTPRILALLYLLFFLIGLPSNLWVIANIFFELRQNRHSRNEKRRQNILLHVLFLSIVDVLCLLSLPIIVVNMLSDFWRLGTILCKLVWIFESPNKLLSNFILTAMAIHCYLAVCNPNLYKSYRMTHTVVISIVSVVVSAACMTPVFVYSDVISAVEFILSNESDTYMVFAQRCTFLADPQVQQIFIGYTFTIGFCCTTAVQLVFHALLICFVIRHKRRARISRLPLKSVTKTVVMLSLFYLFCWAPFWISQLILVFFESSDWAVLVVVHALPYLNSCVNPALYSRINRKADMRHFSSFIWAKVHKQRLDSLTSNNISNCVVTNM